ncbi:MAG: hypothetical protein CMM59_12130, partial [Rhodospirillaceae bacterium]|nr:hypothetical protein [Rhodospirillaceae bacterium]
DCLEILAKDQLAAIQGVMSEAIRSLDDVPQNVVSMLAHDIDELVASPVLEFSPLLSDEELMDVIANGAQGTGLSAIARRSDLAAEVSEKVAASDNSEAINALLRNDSASINEETFSHITDLAEKDESLHQSLANRSGVPDQCMTRIVEFVGQSLLKQLGERNDLDQSLLSRISERVNWNLTDNDAVGAKINFGDPEAIARVREDFQDGTIPRFIIMRELSDQQYAYVANALILSSGVKQKNGVRAFLRGDAKKIAAMAWQSGLDAFSAQVLLEKLPTVFEAEVISPDSTGGYAIGKSELELTIEEMAA